MKICAPESSIGVKAGFRPIAGSLRLEHSDEREGFIDGALHPTAHLWATTSDVDAVSEHDRAHAMPRREHRRISLPAVRCRVVRLILAEYAVRALPTHAED